VFTSLPSGVSDLLLSRCGKHRPMDIEWAKDGIDNKLYIVQARPETVHSQRDWTQIKRYRIKEGKHKILVKGTSVGQVAEKTTRIVFSDSR
jgi:pyruvate,water dikinase